MKKNITIDLRKQAEERLKKRVEKSDALYDSDSQRLIHELRVHQVELEMQNEELRKSRTELEESRARYSDIYDFAPVGYFTFDNNGLILEVNLAGAGQLGVERNRLNKKPFSGFIHRADQDVFFLHRGKVFKTRELQTCELRLKRKNGDGFYAQLQSIAVETNAGKAVYCITAVSDISERKQAEQALRELNETLEQRVEERTKELKDAEKSLREMNETLELRVAERTTALQAANTSLLASRRAALNLTEDAVVARMQSEEANAELRREATERKRAEVELRESEQRLSRSQEIAHLGSWELDLVNNRLFWSDEVYRIFGLRPQEFGAAYETFLEAVHPDDRASVDAAYSRSIREGRATYEIDHRIVRKLSGEVRYVHEKCEHFRDSSGKVIRSVGMVHDITRRKMAEEEIKRHNAVLNGINRIFKQALTSKTDEELARACLHVAEAVTGSKFGFIGEVGTDGLLHVTAISDPGWELCSVYDKTGHQPTRFGLHGIYGRVILDGRSFFTNDPASHPDSIGTPDGHPPLKSFLGVPLQQEGRTTGMIAVGNREGGYRKDDLNSLEALAPTIAEALFRVRAEQKLAASLHEKEVLLHEIHHRVKNNMQVISSLVNLQADTIMDPSIREQLGEVRDRVRSMALVHEKLYQAGGLSKLDFSEYASGLLQYLWQAHGSAAANVRLKTAMQPVNLNVEDAVHCGLILNELATNALKHAFKGSDGGEVTISIEKDEATGRICLRVSDNGMGLPVGLDWRQTTSMGLRLVNMLAEQMNGVVEIGGGPDTEFRLIFTARQGMESQN